MIGLLLVHVMGWGRGQTDRHTSTQMDGNCDFLAQLTKRQAELEKKYYPIIQSISHGNDQQNLDIQEVGGTFNIVFTINCNHQS